VGFWRPKNTKKSARLLWGLGLCFALFPAITLEGQEEKGGIKTATDLQIQISSMPEAKIRFSQSFIFPFLQGSGPLTENNNITALLVADATPVSINAIGEILWTPAAFFQLAGGGKAGSGWNMPLGKGVGINAPEKGQAPPGSPRKAKITGNAFEGLIWSAWGAGILQFDLGAVMPGDWTHVLFQTRQEFRYGAYTLAGPGDSWVFENDDGENRNGWNYYASYVLGYSMPRSPVLNTIAFMAEIHKNLYHTPGGDVWGDSLGYWIFSGLLNFAFHPRFGAALAIQMHSRRNYGTSDLSHNSGYYYQDLALQENDGKRRIIFYRAAVLLNYRIK
jgi:hypothetical protein